MSTKQRAKLIDDPYTDRLHRQAAFLRVVHAALSELQGAVRVADPQDHDATDPPISASDGTLVSVAQQLSEAVALLGANLPEAAESLLLGDRGACTTLTEAFGELLGEALEHCGATPEESIR